MENCPDKSHLGKLVCGELTADHTTHVLNHLDTCLSCAKVLDELNGHPGSFVKLLRVSAADIDNPVRDEPELCEVIERLRGLPVPDGLGSSVNEEGTEELRTPVRLARSLGPWQLLEQIGRGGMGVVYRARHVRLRQERAIKLLPPTIGQTPEALARFEKEIQAVGRLDHEHIVRAFGAEEIDGQLGLIMELVDGEDLSTLVRDHGPMSPERACDYIRQAAVGLHHIDSVGLVHRDLKPRNLTLDKQGRIRILDMGLARLLSSNSNDAVVDSIQQSDDIAWNDQSLTQPGQIMGTLGYIAPEQAANTHDVDIRADIYGLGATLYFLLTGFAPFADRGRLTAQSYLTMVTHEVPTPLRQLRPDVSGNVIALIDRMMARNPGQRFQSPSDVANAIESFTVPSKARSRAHRATAGWITVAAISVLLVGSFAVWRLKVDETPANSELRAAGLNAANVERTPDRESQSHEVGTAATRFDSDKSATEFLLGLGAQVYAYDELQPNANHKPIVSIDYWPGEAGRLVMFQLPEHATISPAQLAAVVDAAPYLNTVLIGFHDELLSEHIVALKRCSQLEDLVLGSVRPSTITDDDLSDLFASAPNLYAVMLQGLNTDGSCLNGITEPERLTSLRIGSMAPIVGEDRRPRLSPEWIRSLSRFPNLHTLSLPQIELTNVHVEAISALPAITNLYAHGASGIDECLEKIAALSNLTELGLSNASFRDSQLARLHAMSGLKLLEVAFSDVSEPAIHEFQKAVPRCAVDTATRRYPPLVDSEVP